MSSSKVTAKINKINTKSPRILIGGTGSNCGKTTVVCGLLKALTNRDKEVGAFKCGPDYIDPMFHSKIIGAKSRNLDMFLCDENTVKYLLGENGKTVDFSVIEGVMGIYDGLGFEDDSCSANNIARITDTPEVLVVNVKGKSASLLAEISGYLNYYENNIKGVILNNCSKGMYPVYQKAIEKNLEIKCFGYFPKVEGASIESRHLGLVTAGEIDGLKEKIEKLGKAAEEGLDIEGLLALGESAKDLEYDDIEIEPIEEKVRIGIASDNSFCFYYEDSLELLEKLGAELVYFSPLEDEKMPENLDGLFLGGGYPELNAKQLEENKSMRSEIKAAIEGGMPVYAECGGFMYLGQGIILEDREYEMVGALSGKCHMTGSLVRFGYKTLCANQDTILCKKGEEIRCHEFHYSDSTNNGDVFTATNRRGKVTYANEANNRALAGYPHVHFYSNIDFARNLLLSSLDYKRERTNS